MPEDYYALLGIEPDASEEAILRAYRERAAEHHPDVSDADDAGETFRRLNRAKAVLTDADRRRRYDRLGHERFVEDQGSGEERDSVTPSRGPGRSTPSDARPGWPASGRADLGALVDRFFGGAPGWIDANASRGIDLRSAFRDAGRPGPWRTADARSGDEPAAGGRECPKCRGRGTFVHVLDTGRGRQRRLEACERCGGDGTVPA